ncbi:transglycosylase family protein [Actinomycetospora sp. CA-101289]|uniref:transglycosylase family protein n=1 Tax=Actinomycetospora sp. CA-101289 TaxID=3239893 RepID=UPI003D98F623
MSFHDRRGADRRSLTRSGVVAVLIAGACGIAGCAAPPVPPPSPPPEAPAPAAGPAPAVPLAVPAEPWDTIARCETGGDWHADTGNGLHGGLQLSPRTWTAYGGAEFAARADDASREQQILIGDRVRSEQGWEAWSGCADDIAPS